MAKRTRTCICCGKTYEYCPTCMSYSNQPKWKINFDNEECKDIFNVVCNYNMDIASDEDVQKVIKKYNIKDFSKFNKDIQDVLRKAMRTTKEQKPVKKVEPTTDAE